MKRTTHPDCSTPRLRFRFNWPIAFLVVCFILSCSLKSDATSVQIQSASAQNYSRCLVRTASGNLYAVIGLYGGGAVQVFESTNGGATWSQQDAAHAPSGSQPSAAIDGNGIIHIAYLIVAGGLHYNTFSTTTNTYSGDTAVVPFGTFTPGAPMTAIAVDSNNATHILYQDAVKSHGSQVDAVTYIDNVGAGTGWNAKVQVSLSGYTGDILINQNNIPQISYQQGGTTVAGLGNANKATTFANQTVASSAVGYQFPEVVLDSANNTWVAYLSVSGNSQVPALVEHRASDPWSTWQTPIQASGAYAYQNSTVSLSVVGTTLYVAYPTATSPNNVVWQSYNGSSWSTAGTFDRSCTNPILRWSKYFNNSPSQIDSLITQVHNPQQPGSPQGAYWNLITSTISGLSATSGTPGTPVTISGSNFGSSQGTSTVTFNGVVATPSSWTSTSIIVNVPGAATSGPVVVSVGGAPSNPVNFTVLLPTISSLSVSSGPVGTPVTLTGANFGTSQGTSTMTFNGVVATVSSWSATSIGTSVPGGATTGPVIVTVNGASSSGVAFTVVYPPSIASLSPNVGSTGMLVSVAGTNFGTTQGTSTISFNGVAATPVSWSTTSITVPVPASATTGNVTVTVAGIASNGTLFTVVPATLQISSPANGTIVAPGQSFSISVVSPNSTSFTAVAVIAQAPFDFSVLQTSVPAQFSFTVPAQLACRAYSFTAVGTATSGSTVQSVPISIDVERPDLPKSISVSTSAIALSAPGETAPFMLLATFADGSILDVTRSSDTVYSSTSSGIATIDANGIVTAVSPGAGFVVATYTAGGQSIPTAVPVTVGTPTLAPSVFSVTFGSQVVGTTSASQSVTLTNMAQAPVRVLSLNTSGDFSETDNCMSASPLSPGANCVVNVTFTPAAVGTRAGTLLISNGTDVAPTSVSLSGPGTTQ